MSGASRPRRIESLPSRPPLELWGGVECSVIRVGDSYSDQLVLTGHATRLEDLDLFATLGVKAMRYPVLWERTAPHGLEEADWSWPDERLRRLRELNIRPIVGLEHHGNGPLDMSLIDPSFPDKLAAFARSVAERYPWVEAYTPVNEPLTTARFSSLYGHWYPHGRGPGPFARALVNQTRAVALAMREIRKVNPAAQLIQTEDVGKTYSTQKLAYQAEFENERRWVTFDMLCGALLPGSRMWRYLEWAGIPETELRWFLDNPCPPDVLGVDYYLTSERFLDERVERYPERFHGSNGRQAYADVEAVRVRTKGLAGPGAVIGEVWDRYRLPLAITEAHIGCTREEQVRWIADTWEAASAMWDSGVDVRAVTAWSLLGSYDWDSLVTRQEGHYEPGAFVMRSGSGPHPTAVAKLLADLGAGRKADHPVLAAPGWWKRPTRLIFGFSASDAQSLQDRALPDSQSKRRVSAQVSARKRPAPLPILITGANGALGCAFARLCEMRGLPYRLLTRGEMDIADRVAVSSILDTCKPWAVINAAGYVRVDDAEREIATCFRENTLGPARLAAACAERDMRLLTFSSDLVFDGSKQRPYVESDQTRPLSVYGRSKADAEAKVLEILPSTLLVRTSAFFGPWDERNFVIAALRALASGRSFTAADDQWVSPTYVPDLAHACLDLLIDGESGVHHVINAGAITWADLAARAAELAGLDTAGIERLPGHALGSLARRPAYSVLSSERGTALGDLDDALARYMRECEMRWRDSQNRRELSTTVSV